MEHVSCQFRENVERTGVDEVATCGLLKLLLGVADDRRCQVRRDACIACCAESFRPAHAVNSVITSLLYGITQQAIEDGGTEGLDLQRAQSLHQWTEQSISRPPAAVSRKLPSCDVVLVCRDSSPQTRRAIECIFDQEEATTIVHLVHDGSIAQDVIAPFRDRWNTLIHTVAQRDPLAVARKLIPELRTEFVGIQDSRTTSRSDRIATAVATLQQHGTEVFASAMGTPSGEIQPRQPNQQAVGGLPTPTLVMRRSTLMDVGALENRNDDFINQLAQEGHLVSLDSRALVTCDDSYEPEGTSEAHDAYAVAFPMRSIACDVVLPFHGHLNFVEQSIEGLLNQENAEIVIHLVDDASPDDTSDLMGRWKSDSRVRAYRNERNLGQYTTFNNVYPFLETDFVAVQDADDVSEPNRIHYAGNCLELADAEIFAAACDLEVDEESETPPWLLADTRYSHYPTAAYGCSLVNPTVVMRKRTFGDLGGFADYRQLLQNRGGLDTEFFQRAYWSGVRFFVSRQRLVRMRIHDASATQNPLTGFGTTARRASNKETHRRAQLYSEGLFEPRTFGGLGNYFGLTKRL